MTRVGPTIRDSHNSANYNRGCPGVSDGRFAIEASPLRHAPHTVHDLADAEWNRSYTREEAVFPAGVSRNDKYWAPVGRVDNVYGDRNLVCICPTPDAYRDEAA
jgi:glycine dehydrogenase